MNAALSAVAAAATSVIVTVCSIFLGERQQRRKERRTQRQELNAKYLNPLRFHLVENHFRLSSINNRTSAHGPNAVMLVIEDPAEVSSKDAAWFTGPGYALMSAVYLTSCLYAQLKKVREDFPYLRLSATDDTRLAALLLRVQRGFLVNGGVYYVTQPSIGESVWVRDDERLLTYREFCEKLQDPTWRVWIDRLILFYLDIARGEKTQRTERLLAALAQLSEFLDACVGGGKSIESRVQAESSLPL
ncbi:hypothetical protein ABZ915_29265 [Streptomyces sp. NPDC046915]|uniref:hypothetical protein n=1 Tax=Streptomyces sp. NPDC046915 TaxID=3155257 RepID=UPI0033F86968